MLVARHDDDDDDDDILGSPCDEAAYVLDCEV